MRWMIATVLSLVLAGPALAAEPTYVVTIHPLDAIVREVVGKAGRVVQLLSPAASPETYEPRPSDLAVTSKAAALFYVSPELDGWAARLPAPRRVVVYDLVPKAYRHPFDFQPGENPHFWTDPLAVKATLPALAERLCSLDAAGCETYRANASAFGARLDALGGELERTLAPVKGQPVILFHPDFEPFAARYGLKVVGVIEMAPGREPTAKDLSHLVRLVQQEKVRALFGDAQLQSRPANVIAEATGLKVFVLDPIGGVAGRETYAQIMRYNAGIFAEALK